MSDYSKNNTNFYDLLPEVYQNDFTKSLFNNLFQRYVTKDELEHVDGYIGTGNPNAIISRKLKEYTPHRQAFQLQPMLYSKFGTIEHMMTWEDVLNELSNSGVNTDTLKDWLTPQKFNWVPPIDFDKILNFRDYYWYNPGKPNDIPQYLTIKNLCNITEAKVILYEKVLSNSGSEFQIINVTENTITIAEDKSRVFSKDFIFYITNSTNLDLQDSYQLTESVEYDPNIDATIITIQSPIIDLTVSGSVSLSEFLEILKTERDCICNGSTGFDKSLFDDNQLGSVLWNNAMLSEISHSTLNDWISSGTTYTLWYNTDTDQLLQYNGDPTDINSWSIIHQNFSIILGKTDGQHFFDMTTGCTYPQNQWVDQNFWVHKSVIPNFVNSKQAQIPIIEFSPYLELNEWICSTHTWKYRQNVFNDFEIMDSKPELIELIDMTKYKLEPGIISLHSAYGDQSSTFQSGYEFNILDSEGAVYPITNVGPGLGGTFTVIGDMTHEYVGLNSVNPNQLPTVFKIRNSPSGLLDQEWNIASLSYNPLSDKTTVTVLSTESINTFSFTGSEIYQSNSGTYSTKYSHFKKVKTSYSVDSIDYPSSTITIFGNIESDIDFTNFLTTSVGTFEYSINTSYDGNITILNIRETIPSNMSSITEIYLDEFRTVIHVNESFNLYFDSGKLSPATTSLNDQWVGYDNQWLYDGIKSIDPVSRQNTMIGLELDGPIQYSSSDYGHGTHALLDFEYKIDKYAEYFLITNVLGLDQIELHSSLAFTSLRGHNTTRVYLKRPTDNRYIRQYGSYTELTLNDISSGDNIYVRAIQFNTAIPRYSEIRIEVGPTVIADIGLSNVEVRTESNDSNFTNDPISGSTYIKLYNFDKHEQVKDEVNQYPIFDLYDIDGNSTKTISSIFKFKEDSSYNIDYALNRRIVTENNDYTFEQGLINPITKELYSYRDLSTQHSLYYVNIESNEIYKWNNFTWNSKNLTSEYYLNNIVSEIEPTESWNLIEGMIWYNPETGVLYRYDGSDFVSIIFDLHTVDPLLKTIWQPGLNSESYDPSYVDFEKNDIAIGSVEGQWEIPDPLYYNVHHENRNEISLLYLTEHISSIIEQQLPIPGFNDSANNTFHINTNPNFGLGGTIREYNDGFDLLLASIMLETSTTNKILDFAKTQYAASIISIKELFIKNALSYMTDTIISSNDALGKHIVDQTILKFKVNDHNASVYFDSPNSNMLSNWIATCPMFGLSESIEPYIIDNDQHILRHHDNHISTNTLLPNVRENIIVNILKSADIRGSEYGQYMGNTKLQYPLTVPVTESEFKTYFGATVISNCKYWYNIQGTNRTLYRLNISVIGPIQPGLNYIENEKWYNDVTSTLYSFNSNMWNMVTIYGDGIIESAWDIIDLDVFNLDTLLEVETQLYSAITKPNTLDLNNIESNTQYLEYSKDSFIDYAISKNVSNPLTQLGIYNINDPFSWNYIKSAEIFDPYTGQSLGTEFAGCWQDLYEKMYGTAFPHREPWVLQGYTSKPTYWDNIYLDQTNIRKWSQLMWTNIQTGVIPNLDVPASGIRIPNNVPVNTDSQVYGIYQPDDLLPPYWDNSVLGNTYSGLTGSVYNNFSVQIVLPHLDYKFGDMGTVEWSWRHSINFNYDQLRLFFRINPLEFYQKTFGITYNTINDLKVNNDTRKVYSHTDGVFHGDVYDNDKIFNILGINQWYTNYNRFYNVDTATSNFQSIWKDFTTPLTYQIGSFIDTDGVDIQNKNFDLVDNDLQIIMKKSKGIFDSHISGLNISVLKIPNTKLAYSTSYDWIFNAFTSIAKNVEYYDVKNHPIHISGNTFTVYNFEIVNIDSVNNTIVIGGDWTYVLDSFEIIGSTNNDGNYTMDSVVFDTTLNRTQIKVIEPVDDSVIDGLISSKYRKHGWETGQEVVMESSGELPVPFVKTQLFYIIRIDDYSFQLSDNRDDAIDLNYILIDTLGTGQQYVGQLRSTFNALSRINNPDVWNEYEIDTDVILSYNTSRIVYGIQPIIDMIYGYQSYMELQGWRFNNDNMEIDSILGRSVTWQLELEKFINELSVIQTNKFQTNDSYEFETVSGQLTFGRFNPGWLTGSKVLLESQDLPEPLLRNVPYYIIKNSDLGIFELANSITDAKNNIAIVILDDGLPGTIELYNVNKSVYTFEINPFMNNVWYENKVGIIADIVKGPFKDIQIDNTIYDQYGQVLNSDIVAIYREDDIAKITMKQPATVNDKHINGVHLYLDGYEHVIIFQNYSTDGFLLYDSFIGLNTGRFDLIFDKQSKFTLRPNIGGRFLSNKTEFISNIESLTKNLEEAYSIYTTIESDKMSQRARMSLGYDSTAQTFLDKLEINDKSQFIFWKGMIQHKGSINAVKAFINSIRFVDAKVDEFWFYKIGEFGDTKLQIYPELHIDPSYTLSNELKIEFNVEGQPVETNFKPITLSDSSKWFEYPNQKHELDNFKSHFYLNAEITEIYEIENGLQIGDNLTTWSIIGQFVKFDSAFDSVYIEGLIEGTDYNIINSKVIEFLDPIQSIKIHILNVAKSKHSPLKIIDYKSDIKLLDLPIWNPGKNHHYHITENLIDIRNDVDPATYTNSELQISASPWSDSHESLIWLDTSMLEYYPYYDTKIEPSVSDRIHKWGKISDFSKVELYQWTKSDIPPTEWNDTASIEELDKNIHPSIRKSGQVRELVYNTATGLYEKDTYLHNEYYVIDPINIKIVDTLTLLTLDQTEIDIQIEELKSKYDVAGYVNNLKHSNAEFIQTNNGVETTITIQIQFTDVNNEDLLTVIHSKYDLVENGLRIYPTENEIQAGDYVIETPYTEIITKNKDLSNISTYYFWVKNKTINNQLTMIEIINNMVNIPIPYVIVQNFLPMVNDVDPFRTPILPNRYNQVIVKGLSNKINDYDRYKLRFTADFTLRDDIEDSNVNLMTTHTEWKLFREQQPYHIDRYLWDRVIESALGTTLDGLTRIPTLDKELYDIENGTDTQYGIDKGQIFLDKQSIINEVYFDLYNPDNDFYPVDIDSFVQSNNFDTNDNTYKLLNDLYNKFASEHLNRIFFAILHSAFSKKLRYTNIQKSSMISLHGIRILESRSIYDD